MTHVCRGASTVMEFIKKVKIFEVVNNYAAQFGEYLKKTGDAEAFSSMTEGEKFYVVCGFLSQNPSVEDKVNSKVAAAYHNGVLRSIMIRQPNAAVGKKKNVENVFFFPTRKKSAKSKSRVRTERKSRWTARRRPTASALSERQRHLH